MTNIYIFIASILILLAGTYFYTNQTSFQPNNLPNQIEAMDDNLKKAPVFSFETIDGRKKDLNDLKGKIILLNFWATWCPPCIKELPDMLEKVTNDERLVLLAVSNDIDKESLDRFLKKQNQEQLNHEDVYIVYDKQKAITQDLFQTYKLPETIIIDENGFMRKKVVGFIDWTKVSIDVLLGKKDVPEAYEESINAAH